MNKNEKQPKNPGKMPHLAAVVGSGNGNHSPVIDW